MAQVDSLALQFTRPGHGLFRTTPMGLDQTMRRYLPASVEELKAAIHRKLFDAEVGDYDDLSTVTECLFVLAELDGYGL